MKKGYLLLPAFLLSTAFAQQNTEGPAVLNQDKALQKSEFTPRSAVNSGSRAPGDIIYSETFTAASAATWTRTGVGSSNGTYLPAALWLRDTDGPNGYYSDMTSDIIASPTVADGFMILDGDYFNGLGNAPAQGAEESFQANLVSPVYDLSGAANVTISFYHKYRICCSSAQSQLWLEVSTDGFNNVAATYDCMYSDAPVNVASGTRQKFVNITNNITGNPANVQLRFRWGTAGANTNASHYYWEIDDLEIFETWANHGQIDTLNWSVDVATFGAKGGFQKIPSYAAATTTLSWTGYMRNIGATSWTNAALQVDQNGSSFATSTASTVNSGAMSGLQTAAAAMPTAVGAYAYKLYGTADQTMDLMDTATFNIAVTSDAYSTGGDTRTGILSGTNWNWNTQPVRVGFGGEIFTSYTGPNEEYITGMRVIFQDTTLNAFAPMEVVINVNGLEYTKSFSVDNALMGSWQSITLDAPIKILPGQVVDYLIVDQDAKGRFWASGTDAYHIGLMVTYDGQNVMSGPYLEAPAAMEMVTDNTSSISENTSVINSLGQNIPNPFNNSTIINFSLTSNEMVSFEVVDVTGKVVKSMALGFQGVGSHTIELNANEFNKGIYFYSLTAGDSKMTKKMVVSK